MGRQTGRLAFIATGCGTLCDVLVVDDDDLVRGTLVSILEDQGWQIREASDPDQAFRIIGGVDGCRVLVTDIHLGACIDGFGVAEAARRRRPGLPVIFISGRSDVLRAHPLDRDERALFKPFPVSDLLSTIREFIPGD